MRFARVLTYLTFFPSKRKALKERKLKKTSEFFALETTVSFKERAIRAFIGAYGSICSGIDGKESGREGEREKGFERERNSRKKTQKKKPFFITRRFHRVGSGAGRQALPRQSQSETDKAAGGRGRHRRRRAGVLEPPHR